MNYLQRLVKRATAKPDRTARDRFEDPFAVVEAEEPQWPVTAPKPATPSHDQPTDENPAKVVTCNETADRPEMNDVRTIVPDALPAPGKPDEGNRKNIAGERLAHQPTEKPAEDEPQILNQESSLSVIDQLMEPYVAKLRPELPTSPAAHAQQDVATTQRDTPESSISDVSGREMEPARSIAPLRPAEPQAAVTTRKLTPEIVRADVPKAKKSRSEDSKNETRNESAKTTEPEPSKTQRQEVRYENRIIVVNRSTDGVVGGNETGGGTPDIGIGQL